METQKPTELYDSHYFATGCGRPYRRDQEWLNFFDSIAQHIVTDINPRTVLDAGCAMGFLVERLRKYEVEAYGVDISEYAIQNVHVDIQPYCWIGSVIDSFLQTYDLIVCIEVLEHMTAVEAQRAIANFCQHSDDILFSSTPFDYKEITHFNVQLPEYWAKEFARHGFFRDVDFDATFITPWAIRFRRRREPVHEIVHMYERRFWPLWKESNDLRDLSVEMRQKTRQLQAEKEQIETIYVNQVKRLIHEKGMVEHRTTKLKKTIGWEVMLKLQSLRSKLAPPKSLRDQWLEELFLAVRHKRLLGGVAFFISQKLKFRPSAPVFYENQQIQDDTYLNWIDKNEPTQDDLKQQRIATFDYQPLISFITPVYNPPPETLRATLDSVLAQTYENWQLCLANGGHAEGSRSVLEEFAARDDRIQVEYLSRNLGISGNSNKALAMAKGEFIAILDHDDLLAPHMLFEVVKFLNQQPDANVIYFDEDKISEDGFLRQDPFFKPDWSPYVLLSTNYLMHSVFRREFLLDAGMEFYAEMDGAQDWDLALRCSEKTNKIYHIPKILYHWRKTPGSVAGDSDAKPWAHRAQIRSLQAHLTRIGAPNARVSITQQGWSRIMWPTSGAKVSIIVPSKDKASLLLSCISSILKLTNYADYEIIVVDTGSGESSTQHYYDLLTAEPRVSIVSCFGNFNYSRANNLGVTHATGKVLLFLNNDTEVIDSTWLDDLVGWIERPDVGIVGAKLLYPDDTIQHAGLIVGLTGHASQIYDKSQENHHGIFGSPEWYREYMAVTGACMGMRRDVFDKLGGFDETYQVGYSDIEFCLRARAANYLVVYSPFARLLHHEGATRGFSLPPSDVLRASLQMMPLVQQGDPYFNSNLSYAHRQPRLALDHNHRREMEMLKIMEQFHLLKQADEESLNNLRNLSNVIPLAPVLSISKVKLRDLMVFTHDLSLSGAPLALSMAVKNLTLRGYQFTVYSAKEGPLRRIFEQIGIKVYVDPHLLDYTDLTSDSLRLVEFLNRHDGVVANTILCWQAIYAARALQKPSIWWIHESGHGLELAEQRVNIASAFAAASAVIFPADSTRRLYEKLSQDDNYFTIPYGLDLEQMPSQRNGVEFASNKFRLVHVGSIESRKGQDVLVKAIAALPERIRKNIDCYLIGRVLDTDFYEGIKELAQGLEAIHFVGESSHEETIACINSADIFVLTSRDEVLPITVLEAMALGKAIIATNVGGVSEVIEHDTNGLLFPTQDHQVLMTYLNRLYKESETVARLGAAARRTFEQRLTINHFVEHIEQVFEAVLENY